MFMSMPISFNMPIIKQNISTASWKISTGKLLGREWKYFKLYRVQSVFVPGTLQICTRYKRLFGGLLTVDAAVGAFFSVGEFEGMGNIFDGGYASGVFAF